MWSLTRDFVFRARRFVGFIYRNIHNIIKVHKRGESPGGKLRHRVDVLKYPEATQRTPPRLPLGAPQTGILLIKSAESVFG